MEKLTLKAGSIFLSEVFQFMIAEKCNIQIIFENVINTFARACYDVATLSYSLTDISSS